MSIAWSGIVLLVLLLPGFLFFVGLYFPEKFTREAAERSPLGQLAGTVLIAFVVHSSLFLLNSAACGSVIPCIRLDEVLSAIALDSSRGPQVIQSVARSLEEDPVWIFLYVLLAGVLGTAAGWATGLSVVNGRFRFLAQHRWVYDLKVEDQDVLTVAYVLTKVNHQGRHLVYRGFLKAFGLQRDGRFSYLLLTNVVRYYLVLEETAPVTTSPRDWIVVGRGAEYDRELPGTGRPGRKRDLSYFAIEGEDISNVIFDRHVFPFVEDVRALEGIIARVEQEQSKPAPVPTRDSVD